MSRLPFLALLFLLAAGCAQRSLPYADARAYCAAAGTIDHPDDQYGGPALPEWVIPALARAMNDRPGDGGEALLPVTWRCAGGAVVACSIGLGAPCGKASTSRVPSLAMLHFCRAFPDIAQPLPRLSGTDSAFLWECRDGWPHIVAMRQDLDRQGFLRRYWFRVKPEGFSVERQPQAAPRATGSKPA